VLIYGARSCFNGSTTKSGKRYTNVSCSFKDGYTNAAHSKVATLPVLGSHKYNPINFQVIPL
jgi:hypothetical protein